MSCTQNFCYNISEQLTAIKDMYEAQCWSKECNNVLLPKEREVLMQYIQCEYLDRRTMELARCFIQNVLRSKKDKSIKQFASISQQQISGRVNPERNMLSQVKQCKDWGLESTTSQAKFMGSVSTSLKCDTSSFNIPTIKKIINETNWRFKAHFNTVQKKAMDDLIKVFHSYILGTRCGNCIRTWTPNVAYTYGLYGTQCPKTLKRNFCTLSEKLQTVANESNLRDMLLVGKLTPELFLSVLGQVAFTLELMQQKQGFSHSNLFADHVMIRPVYNQTGTGVIWSYMIYGKEYKMRSLQFLATLVNFTKSSFDPELLEKGQLELGSGFVGAGVNDFLVPGKDLCLLLQSIRQVLIKTLDPSDSKHFLVDAYGQENNTALLSFCDYALQNFFQAPQFFFEKGASSGEAQIHDVMVCQGAGLTPLGFIEMIENATDKVKEILKVSKLPWVCEDRQAYLPAVCKKKIPLFLADLMPNWKSIVEDKTFFQPVQPLKPEEVSSVLDLLLDLEKNKKIIQEIDFRPIMTIGEKPFEDNLEFYQKNILNPDGYFNGALQNTILFYNNLIRFIENYYYAFFVQDQDMMTEFSKNNNKITVLMRTIHKPMYVSNIANIVRFIKMVVAYKDILEKRSCCAATKQTLGSMAQQGILQQQSLTQQKTQGKKQDIYKIVQQEKPCGPKTPVQSYPLQQKKQQKKQQTFSQQQQALRIPSQRSQSLTQRQQTIAYLPTGLTSQQQNRLPPQQQARLAQQQARLNQQARLAQQQARRVQQQARRLQQQQPPPPPMTQQQARLAQQQARRLQQQAKRLQQQPPPPMTQQQARRLQQQPPPPPPMTQQGRITQQVKVQQNKKKDQGLLGFLPF